MPDMTFNSGMRAALLAFFGSGTFKAMLVTSSYAPNKDTHAFRSDVTNEIVASAGYTPGGKAITVTVEAVDTGNDTIDVSFGPISWEGLTATGIRQIVIYKALGGAASADPVVYCQDADTTTDADNQTYDVGETVLRIAVPAV